jgi:transcriptional regulator with XRE-family HTH domain
VAAGRAGSAVKGLAQSEFVSLLRQLRTAAGLTQDELAASARLSPRSVSDLERGVSRTARPETTRRLAAALGLSEPALGRFRAAAGRNLVANESVMPTPAAPGLAAVRALPRDIAGFTGRGDAEAVLTPVDTQAVT